VAEDRTESIAIAQTYLDFTSGIAGSFLSLSVAPSLSELFEKTLVRSRGRGLDNRSKADMDEFRLV
jgi:hypothetical protein